MSDTSDPKQLSVPFHPTMINKVIELELRRIEDGNSIHRSTGILKFYTYRDSCVYYRIEDDNVIHRSAGILKLYTYRDSWVHYRMEAYGEAAVVDLDLYYFSILHVV